MMKKRGNLEVELLSSVKHIIGRTTWDKAHSFIINPTVCYHYNGENLRDELKENKEMKEIVNRYTLEELREMKLVSNTNGRPTSTLTDEKWQKEFRLRKLFITPHNESVRKLSGKYSKESGIWNEETMGTYYGCTSWQSYCSYINDVLNNIRMGQIDYCYYIFQIMELARFHYNTLRTKYCDGYWEVWLER